VPVRPVQDQNGGSEESRGSLAYPQAQLVSSLELIAVAGAADTLKVFGVVGIAYVYLSEQLRRHDSQRNRRSSDSWLDTAFTLLGEALHDAPRQLNVRLSLSRSLEGVQLRNLPFLLLPRPLRRWKGNGNASSGLQKFGWGSCLELTAVRFVFVTQGQGNQNCPA